MVDDALTRNDNKVVQRGAPFSATKRVKTATNVKPGRLVERDTTDAQVKVGGVGSASYAWAGHERCLPQYQPLTIDTAFSANDEITVHWGPGCLFRAYLANGQNVTMGAKLVRAANGELTVATAAAPAAGGTALTGTSAQPTMAGSMSGEGPIVAEAMESVDASGSALPIMIKSMI